MQCTAYLGIGCVGERYVEKAGPRYIYAVDEGVLECLLDRCGNIARLFLGSCCDNQGCVAAEIAKSSACGIGV